MTVLENSLKLAALVSMICLGGLFGRFAEETSNGSTVVKLISNIFCHAADTVNDQCLYVTVLVLFKAFIPVWYL